MGFGFNKIKKRRRPEEVLGGHLQRLENLREGIARRRRSADNRV